MSIDQIGPMADSDESEPSDDTETEELAAQVELLVEENNRLREEYARSQQTRYRRTAAGLVVVGLIAVFGGLVLPTSRTVLFALGGTGLFAGLLTYYLTPERFVAANISESMYTALAETETALVDELGLQETRVYIPLTEAGGSAGTPAQLFVPQNTAYRLPTDSDLDSLFVISDADETRGVSLYPTGGPLFREFEQALSTELGSTPEILAEQLTDGLLEQLELIESAVTDIDRGNNQISIGVSDSVYGEVDRFDHPVASFLGVGVAVGLDESVAVETSIADGDRADYLVTCSWPASEGQSNFEFRSDAAP